MNDSDLPPLPQFPSAADAYKLLRGPFSWVEKYATDYARVALAQSSAIPRELHDRLIHDARREALLAAAQWFRARGVRGSAAQLERMADEAEKEKP